MPYKLIDHTADIGIRVTDKTIDGLFETAAHAMFDQITDRQRLTGQHAARLTVSGIDREDLLVNFLRELLSFWTIDTRLVKNVNIKDIQKADLLSDITYDTFDPDTHEILKDIKAVTYHGISIEQTGSGWQTTIIFDV